MSLFLGSCTCSSVFQLNNQTQFTARTFFKNQQQQLKRRRRGGGAGGVKVKAFFLDPTQEPLVKEALKEPVAFMGGLFAGLLRLDLNEDPLKDWLTRTVEASATDQETQQQQPEDEETPQQIQIE